MKKRITAILLFISIFSFAQGGALADLKFEEAEIAFNNKDYNTTISKLNEFDKMFGSVTSKSLYLRIISEERLFDPQKLYEDETYFTYLTKLRKYVASYLNAMESEGIDDKYREVYKLDGLLKKKPLDKKSWLVEKKKIDEKKQASIDRLEKIKKYDEEKEQYYKEIAPKIDLWEYSDMIKIGTDFNDFKTAQKEWFKGVDKIGDYQYTHNYNKNFHKNFKGNQLQYITLDKSKKVDSYAFCVSNNIDSVNEEFQKLMKNLEGYFGQNLVFDITNYGDLFQLKGYYDVKCYVVKSPFSNYRITIQKRTNSLYIEKEHISWNKFSLQAAAFSLEYLDRFVGTYSNGKTNFKISRIEGLSLLKLEASNNNIIYYLQNFLTTDTFNSFSYLQNGKIIDYNNNNKGDEFQIIFNVEQNSLTFKGGGKEITYNKMD